MHRNTMFSKKPTHTATALLFYAHWHRDTGPSVHTNNKKMFSFLQCVFWVQTSEVIIDYIIKEIGSTAVLQLNLYKNQGAIATGPLQKFTLHLLSWRVWRSDQQVLVSPAEIKAIGTAGTGFVDPWLLRSDNWTQSTSGNPRQLEDVVLYKPFILNKESELRYTTWWSWSVEKYRAYFIFAQPEEKLAGKCLAFYKIRGPN